jgi:hypothetical protein
MALSHNGKAMIVGGSASTMMTTLIGALASGSSAAGMTSALATAGTVIGGGMAAGILVVAVAPVAAGTVGYLAYKKYMT